MVNVLFFEENAESAVNVPIANFCIEGIAQETWDLRPHTHIYWYYIMGLSQLWLGKPTRVTTTSAATIFLPPIVQHIVISVIHQWSRPLWDAHPKKSLERSAIRVVAPFPGCPGLNWSEILVSCLVISHLSSPVDQLHIQVGYAILYNIIYI